MPYLHCPRCRKTAWTRAESTAPTDCRHCGRPLDPTGAGDVALLTAAVRERFARDSQRPGPARFVRP